MDEDSWSRNHVGGIIKEESSRRNMEGESWRRKHGSHEQPRAARSNQEQPGAARSSQEQPGAARSSQEQPGPARAAQIGSWLQMLSNLFLNSKSAIF